MKHNKTTIFKISICSFLGIIIISTMTMIIIKGCAVSRTVENKMDSSYGVRITSDKGVKNAEKKEVVDGKSDTTDPKNVSESFADATATASVNNVIFNEEQIESISKELFIPEYISANIEVAQGDVYLWEGTGMWMVPVAFYIKSKCIAQADVNIDDYTMMRSVIPYEYDPSVEKLEMDTNPEINELMEKYYNAVSDGDIDTLNDICRELGDGDIVRIRAKSSLINSYEDIHCYTMRGPWPKTSIVYVTFYTKYNDIDSMVPGLNTYYVSTEDSDDNYYIYINNYNIDKLTEDEKNYIGSLNNRDDVKALIQDVDKRYNEILQNDPDVDGFMSNLPITIDQLSGVVRNEEDSGIITGINLNRTIDNDSCNH